MSEQIEIVLDPAIIKMLAEMEAVFVKFDIDYYIVGAFARDIQFQTKQPDSNFRKTNDVDLAVCISHEDRYNEVMDALVATGSFVRDEIEIIKLHYHLGIEVDLIPFGEIEDEKRDVKLTKPKVFTLQMPGFREAASFTEEIKSGNLILKTCPIEGLVMLKLISWDDKPKRTHDLTDIDNIIDAYFDWNSDEVYEFHNDIFNNYDGVEPGTWEKVISAHVIGRKMKPLLADSKSLFDRINQILEKRQNPKWRALQNGLCEI